MIHAALLAALISKCAPQTDVRTLAAIVAVESSGDAWAIRDPIAGRALHPTSYAQAVTTAHGLLVHGSRVSVGLSQVLLPRPGLNAATLLGSPCANLQAGAAILADAYAQQIREVADPSTELGQQVALRRALSVYNSGSPNGAPAYARRVIGALSSGLVEEVTSIADSARSASSQRVRAGPVRSIVLASKDKSIVQPRVSSLFFSDGAR